jgi:hypothetical protein
MTRTMYDGIEPGSVPAGADIYAGYDDGAWQSLAALKAANPGKPSVSICVTATGTARVLDIENGDAQPEEAPAWAARQRAGGNPWPVCYMNTSTWGAVKAAFAAQGVAAPLYWVASYVKDPTVVPAIPAGAIALQYFDYGGYDASVVADYWPGLDPEPQPAAAAALEEDEDDMSTTSNAAGRAGLSWAAGSKHVVQVGYDPAGGNPTLRVVLVLTTGPLVVANWTFTAGLGTGVYELPEAHIAACRGVILEWADGSAKVTYDATAV